MVPFGHATESIVFGGACGGNCDFRTVSQPNRGEPSGGTLTDIVVGGTGMFTAASGIVSGRVYAAGPQSAIKLSGTITLQT